MSSDEKRRRDHVRYLAIKAGRDASRDPDPITLLSDEDRAYIAGLFDGEGTVYIAKTPKTMYPIVAIGMTHRGVIDWLCEKLRTPRVTLNNGTSMRKHPNWRPQWLFRMHGRRAKLFIETVRPFLKVKAEHAAILADYPVDARIAPGVKIASTDINATRESLRLRIKKLNRRGRAAMAEAA